MISGWRYYNHAAVPTTPPHINPNLEPIENGSIWKSLGGGYCSFSQVGNKLGLRD